MAKRGCSDKMKRCVTKVKARGGGYNAYAVCKASLSGTTKRRKKSKKKK